MISDEDLDKEIEAFIREHGVALQGILRARIQLPQGLVEEVMNDTFLAVAHKLRRGEELTAPRAFAVRVARNAAIDRLRERFRATEVPSLPDLEDSGDGVDMMAGIDLSEDLRRSVKRLPDRQQRVIELRYLRDFSIAETADMLDIAPGTVASTTAAAIQNLRRIIKDEGGTWDGDFQ